MRSTILLAFTALIFTLSGCDMVRSKLGMPGSAELETARKIRDSIEKSVVVPADSIKFPLTDSTKSPLTDSTKSTEAEKSKSPAESGDLSKGASLRYQVIAGSFKDHENAARMGEILKKLGIEPGYIDFQTGSRMVSAGGYATIDEAREAVKAILEREGAPGDLWIYDSRKR
ncbi:MAG: SPOR domain-containing protein [Bacteroidales bacterium]|nr:SPOR domain-containing protein [Bacteroidales bacterium]MDD2425372.1 SPOR domain-containing protein [Bacteroidales bacterium]MDD3988789.1 SPOR domain-containing protein [Bacteroidales bacterium]MDD4639406.1 SPOR domain-containing protein [Bacteroidales bacterium]